MMVFFTYCMRLSFFLAVLSGFFLCAHAETATELQKAESQRKIADSTDADKLNQLGFRYYQQGKYQQALPFFQRALAIREKQLGAEHPSTATSLNNLAELYKAMANYSQAEPLSQRALAIREKQLGANHPSIAISLNNLALLYQAMGNYSQAELLYQRALAIREKQLGAEHLSTAISLNNLASIYYAMGNYSQAEPLYQRALAIYEKQLGAEHSLIATSLDNLAELYRAMGNYSQALPFFQRALAIREKQLGAEHPSTATSLNNLALLYCTMGNYSQAEPLYQRALAIHEKQLGVEHPSTATSLSNLASLYKIMGNYSQAEPLYQRALAIGEKQLGAEHPSTATSLNNLALLYYTMGNYSQAEPLYQRALAIREKQLGAEHPSTAISLNNLAELYREMGNYSQAEPLYQRALAIHKKQLGAKHPSTATSLNNLAELYYDMDNHSQAEPLYQRALAIREKQLGAEHPSTAMSLNNVAALYYTMGNYSQAEPLYQRALAIDEKQLGAEHPSTAMSLNNLAVLYYTMGNYSQAEPLYQRALAIREQQLGLKHPHTATSLGNYAWLLKQQNNAKAAIFFLKRTINVLQASRKKNKALPKALKVSFINKKQNTYRNLANWLIEADRLAEAEQVLDMLEEKDQYDYFKGIRRNKNPSQVAYTLEEETQHKRFREIEDQLVSLGKEFNSLHKKGSSTHTPEEKERFKQLKKDKIIANKAFFDILNQIVNQLNTETKSKLADDEMIAWQDNNAKQMSNNKTRTYLKKLQQHSKKKIVHVRYLVLEKELKILLSTPTSPLIARSIKITQQSLREKILAYRMKLKGQKPLRAEAKELYRYLIQPIENDLQQADADMLMLSPQDVLNYLPFAALHNGEQYLIQRYALSIYNAGKFNIDQQKTVDHIAAMGVSKGSQVQKNEYSQRQDFAPLKHVPRELDHIVQQDDKDNVGVVKGSQWLNETFSLERFKAALEPEAGFTILHLATHFHFDPSHASNSFLLLGNNKTLSVGELAEDSDVMSFVNIRLLVLSACATALDSGLATDQDDGKEIKSFAGAAQDNGAEAVLASLWSVDDESTSRLMQTLYRYWQQDKLSRLEALQKAQQDFIAKQTQADCPALIVPGQPVCDDLVGYAGKSHPYYWAPFVLMGNWL